MLLSIVDRFYSKIEPIPECGCYIWMGSIDSGGYGRLKVGRQAMGAHRVAWLIIAGRDIPAGMELDHLCRIRCCVNPDHLEPVTRKENIRRGRLPAVKRAKRDARTHCAHGHPLKDNVYQYGDDRHCKTCKQAQAIASYHRSAIRRRAAKAA